MSDFPRVALLQSSSPGVQQAGNINISGVMLASRLVAGASVSSADIEINKTVVGSVGISIQNASNNSAAYSQVELKDDAGTHGLRFSVTSSGATPASHPDLSAFGTGTTLTLGTTDGTAITINGLSVGVGTPSPNALFHVAGPVIASGSSTHTSGASQTVLYQATTTVGAVKVYGPDSSTRGKFYVQLAMSDGTNAMNAITVDATSYLLGINSGATPTTAQIRITANNAGGLSFLTYAVNNSYIGFDMDYTTSSWYARDTTAFRFYKNGGKLAIAADSGLTAGNTYTPTDRIYITSDGCVGVGAGNSPPDSTRQFMVASTYAATSAAGVTFQAVCTASAAETNVREAANIVTTITHTTGSVADVRNIAFTFSVTGSGGTTALARNIVATCDVGTGATVTTRYGYHYFETSGAGTLGTQVGVYIDALTKGGTANWAIYTAGATKSFFGGNVMVGGGLASASNPGTLTVSTNTAALPTGFTDSILHVSGADNVSTRVVMDAFMGTGDLPPNLTFRAAAGTAASPTAIAANKRLGQLAFFGRYDSSNYVSGNRASIIVYTGEDWGLYANGTYMTFSTTINTTTTASEKMRIHSNGNVGIGSQAPPSTLSLYRALSDTLGDTVLGFGYSTTVDYWGWRVSTSNSQSLYLDRYNGSWVDSPFIVSRVDGHIGMGADPSSVIRVNAGVTAGSTGNEIIGMRAFASRIDAEASANTTGFRSEALAYFSANSQTIGHLICYTAKCEASGGYTSDTLGDATGFVTDMVIQSGVTAGEIRHFYVPDVSGTGSVTTQYGLLINDLTKGSTNYSIYTGSALCRFGGQMQNDLLTLSGRMSSTFFVQTADATTTANNLTTLFGTGQGTLTLPANFLVVGRTIRIRMGGYISTADTSTGTKTLTLKLGGTTIATGTSSAAYQTTINQAWVAEAEFVCRTTGSTGTVQATAALFHRTGSASASLMGAIAGSTSTTQVNTTGTLAIDLLYNNGVATGAQKTTWATVEWLY